MDTYIIDTEIKKYIQRRELIENLKSEKQINQVSVDLTLSDSCKKIGTNNIKSDHRHIQLMIDSRESISYEKINFVNDHIDINPLEFLLVSTNEIVNIPNGFVGFVTGKSSIARLGLQTEQAGLVNPGFRGTITLELFNSHKDKVIRLYKDMPIIQICFMKTNLCEIPYNKKTNSKYMDQIEATGFKI